MRRRDVMLLGAASLAWPGRLAEGQPPDARLALVIGNAAYSEGIGPLRNTINDAALIAGGLEASGFALHGGKVFTDLGRRELLDAVRTYEAALASAGPDAVGCFYYAGHGAAHPERGNYLIPVGDYQELDETLWDDSIALNWLFDRLGSVLSPQVVCIDACRNVLRLPRENRDISGGQPFRSLRTEAGEVQRPNMFISYATWEGQLASDGTTDTGNGPYALAVAQNMQGAGQTVRDMFETVRLDVLELTGQLQEPMNISRLSRASKDLVIAPLQDYAYSDTGTEPGIGGVPWLGDGDWRGSSSGTPLNHALVVANDYSDAPDLALAGVAGDADAIAAALGASGFRVAVERNATRDGLRQAVARLAARLADAGTAAVGLVYFAGFGGRYRDDNFLVPAGDLPRTAQDLPEKAVRVEDVITELEATPAGGLILLIDSGRVLNEIGARALQTGFASEYGRSRTVLAFSTSPGETAADPQAPSAFAAAFAGEILTPGRRDAETVLTSVRTRVRDATGGGQLPYFVSSARAPIFFRSGEGLDQTGGIPMVDEPPPVAGAIPG